MFILRTLFSSCSFSYHETNIKQTTVSALGEPIKAHPFMSGGILYPCATTSNRDSLQHQLTNDNRLLWATLTPHGTRHFVSDYPVSDNDAQYEVVGYRANPESDPNHIEYFKRTPIKVISFILI